MNIPSQLRIVFFGTPSFVVPVLESLQTHFTLVGVVTAPDTFNIRKKRLEPSAVKHYCIETIPTRVLTPEQLDDSTREQLQSLRPDLFIVAAYGKLVPENILSIPNHGALNIHPSLLPKHRGPSPIQTAILNGDKETGITIIQMDKELDHGPILFKKTIPIASEDTFASLHIKLFQESANMLPGIIDSYIQHTSKPEPQDDAVATYSKKIKKADGYIALEGIPPQEKLDRMIRAYYPWPTVWTKIRIKNSPRARLDSARLGEAGQEVRIKFLPKKQIQVEGGRVMSMKDFMNGYPELKEIVNKIFQ